MQNQNHLDQNYYNGLKKPHQVPFGNMGSDAIFRGNPNELFNPPKYMNDDYYWIRSDARDDPTVLDLLNRENQITQLATEKNKSTEDQLYDEMKSRIQDDDQTHPHRHYLTQYMVSKRYTSGAGYPVYCRTDFNGTGEQVILDCNEIASGHDTCTVINVMMSYNGLMLAYAVDYRGDELYDLHFKDLSTGTTSPNKLCGLLYADYTWSPTNQHIYYVRHDEYNRMNKLHIYDIKTQLSELLYEERDSTRSIEISVSDDLLCVFVSSGSKDENECYYIDPYNGPHSLHLIKGLQPRVQYTVESYDADHWLVLTSCDGATNFKLMICEKSTPGEWTDFIPYDALIYITGIKVFSGFVVVSVRKGGLASVGYIMKDSMHSIPVINYLNII
jgi:oligopeptidase B